MPSDSKNRAPLAFALLALGACVEGGPPAPPPPDPCAPRVVEEVDAGVRDAAAPAPAFPHNVIVLLGDGVGPTHWEAARLQAGGSLAVDALEGPVLYATDSLSTGGPTDSAASATALATGRCTTNGRLGVDTTGAPMRNVLELAAMEGKLGGVATNTIVIDASPMAFAAHSPSRYCGDELAGQLFELDGLSLVLGGFVPDSHFAGPGLEALASDAGWTVVHERAELLQSPAVAGPVLGLFGAGPSVPAWPEWEYGLTPEVLREPGAESDEPTLAELADFALAQLGQAPDGFVLMLEDEHPDTVGHEAHLDVPRAAALMPGLVLELDAALARVIEWVERESSFDETLVVVCSDHETGGYTLGSDDAGMPLPPSFPAAPNHTSTPVPIYARGPGSERLGDVTHVSDIFHLLTGELDALPGTGACP